MTKFQGKLASLQQVSSPNSQDNFQICCADMYLVRFLANFAGFRVFLWISRDSQIYLKFAAPRPREISEALNKQKVKFSLHSVHKAATKLLLHHDLLELRDRQIFQQIEVQILTGAKYFPRFRFKRVGTIYIHVQHS